MRGFISYAHDDYDDFKILEEHLKQIELGTGFSFWCDERINAGYDWDAAIIDEIHKAKVFLLLASTKYFNAEYVMSRELPAILNARKIDDALIIPVVLRKCDLRLLKGPQPVPTGENKRIKPIDEWGRSNDAYDAVREQILGSLHGRFGLKTTSLLDESRMPTSQEGLAILGRELRLIERVAADAASDTRINQPEIFERLRPLAALGAHMAEVAMDVPEQDIIEQLEALNSLIKRSALITLDPDSDEPIAEQLRAREGLGNISLCVEQALAAARNVGFANAVGRDGQLKPPAMTRARIGADAIRDMSSEVERIEKEVGVLDAATISEPPVGELPKQMVSDYTQRMSLRIDLAKLELANDNTVDLSSVEHSVDEMKDMSAQFAATARELVTVFGESVRRASSVLQQSTASAVVAVRRVLLKIWSPEGAKTTHQLQVGDTFKDSPTAPEMVVVPAGTFTMGSPDTEERWSGYKGEEEPQHQVTISQPFAVGRFAVTVEEFTAFVNATSRKMPDTIFTFENEKWEQRKGRSFRNPGFSQGPRHPVVGVSWGDADDYCKWLSGETSKSYRLLSETEWEYACRAGTDTPFWWGADISTEQANYDGNSTYGAGLKGEYQKGTLPVDRFDANPWGLYQTHGNVWEWCADNWHKDYNDAPTDGLVWPGGDTSLRVVRGGGWFGNPQYLRSANRFGDPPDGRFNYLGFRIARTLTP